MSIASFLSRVAIKHPTECWLWTGCTYNCGYGSFKWRGKMRGSNRVAWEIYHGKEVPEGMDVLHSCDVRLCCNPMHLWIGTHQDNMLDMHRKGRQPLTLSHDTVRSIRRALNEAEQRRGIVAKIARQFKVHPTTVAKIRDGKSYLYVNP